MGRSLVFSPNLALRFSGLPRTILPPNSPNQYFSLNSRQQSQHGFQRFGLSFAKPIRNLCTKAVISEASNEKLYARVGAESTGSIPIAQLIEVVEKAGQTGAEVVMDAVNKPRNITYKGLADLVTEDGTTNFAHGYPSFAVSVGVLFRGKPAAAAVVEFVGGPMCWNTRIFSATAGGGAFCNGQKIHASLTDEVERSLLVTGFGYEHDDAWITNIELFKEFTDVSRIVEEAGGKVTCMDGGKFNVFDRSVLVSNSVLHGKLLERIAPATEKLKSKGIDFSLWYKPEDYKTDI